MSDLPLKQQAEEALQELLEKTIQAGEFIASEVPLVIQELLVWEFAKSLVFFVLGILTLLVGIYGLYRFTKWGLKKNNTGSSHKNNFSYHLDGIFPLVYILGSVATVLGSVIMINLTWLQIWLAPRVFLLEYASELVK